MKLFLVELTLLLETMNRPGLLMGNKEHLITGEFRVDTFIKESQVQSLSTNVYVFYLSLHVNLFRRFYR